MGSGILKGRWVKWAFNPRVVGFVLLIGLVGWTALLCQQVHELQKQRELSRGCVRLIEAQQKLLVPSEVIYFYWDVETMIAVAEARLKSYASLGLDSYLPYSCLWYGGRETPTSSKLVTHIREGLEDYWINTVPDVCHNIAYHIESEIGLGLYLKQNPELFDAHLRPLLVRLLDSYRCQIQIGACDVLLAMGDRSEELMEIIQLTAVNQSSVKDDTNWIIEKYGLALQVSEEKTRMSNMLRLGNEPTK